MKIPMTVNTIQEKFIHHANLKNKVLKEINSGYSEQTKDDGMSITRYDWMKSKNFNRPWVKILKPYLQQHFNSCAKQNQCEFAHIHDLWFQQYIKTDIHPWHTHGENFTGVYYLDYPSGSSATQIIDHSGKLYNVNVTEGDVIVFPSFFIHRSPPIEHDITKTIISFNIEYCEVINEGLISYE